MSPIKKSGIATLLAGAAVIGLSAASFGGEYDGITIHVMTRPGKVIAQRIVDRGLEFTKMTGAKVEVAEVPFAELFQKVQTDWTTGTNSVDVGVVTAEAQLPDGQPPRRRHLAEEPFDVAAGHLGEVRSHLVRGHQSGVARRAQQRARQRT